MTPIAFTGLHLGLLTGHPTQLSEKQHTAELLRLMLARWGECSRRDIKAYLDSLPVIPGWNITAIQNDWPKILQRLCREGDVIQVSSTSYWAVPLKGYRLSSGEVFLRGCHASPDVSGQYEYRGDDNSLQRWCRNDKIDFCELESFEASYPPPFRFYNFLRALGVSQCHEVTVATWDAIVARVAEHGEHYFDLQCQLNIPGEFNEVPTQTKATPEGTFPAFHEPYDTGYKEYRIAKLESGQIERFIPLPTYEEYNSVCFVQTAASEFPIFEKNEAGITRKSLLPDELQRVYRLLKNSRNLDEAYEALRNYCHKHFKLGFQ